MEIHQFIHYISLSSHVSGLPPFDIVKFVITPHHHEANITGPCAQHYCSDMEEVLSADTTL